MNKYNSCKKFIEKFAFPFVITVWPLVNVFYGCSLSDTTYSLSNYMFFDSMAGSWKYATYISNLIGSILIKLCAANMLWMNILTGFVISLISLFVYYSMKNEISSGILFITLLVSEALCWCPSVILYNYLTYLCFTVAAILVYKAVVNNNKRLYYLAGVVLGVSFFVRISNIVQVLLILSVWLGIALYKAPGKKAVWIKPTIICIAGFLTGALAVLIFILITSGGAGIIEAVEWAAGLFTSGSKDDAGGYSAAEMLKAIFAGYTHYAKWFLAMLAGIVLGMMGFMTLRNRFILIKKIGYMACLVLFFIWYNRNGVFNLYYKNTGAIFGLSVIFILCQFVVLFYTAIDRESGRKEKLLAFIAITILLITPLGSNNHLFTVINNMFLTMPIAVWLFFKLINAYKKEVVLFPLISMAAVFFIVYIIQASLFHVNYVFKCGEDGSTLNCKVENESVVSNIYMAEDQANIIDEALQVKSEILKENIDSIVLYGDIPGLAYVLEMPAAISTTWPDLDSYSIETLKEDIDLLKDNNLLIIKKENIDEQDTVKDDKLQLILDYAKNKNNCYNGKYIVAFY